MLVAGLTALMIINGVVMVASPTAWDGLPKWLKVVGAPNPNGAFALRLLYIRMVGTGILSSVAWLLYALTNW